MTGAIVIEREMEGAVSQAGQCVSWEVVSSALRLSAGHEAWEHWLKSLQPCDPLVTNSTASFTIATAFLRTWVERHYSDLLVATLLSQGVQVSSVQITTRSILRKVENCIPQALQDTTAPARRLPSPLSIVDAFQPPAEQRSELWADLLEYDDREPLQEMIDALPADMQARYWAHVDDHFARHGILPARGATILAVEDAAKADREPGSKAETPKVHVAHQQSMFELLHLIGKSQRHSVADIKGKGRQQSVTYTRHLCMYFMRHLTSNSLPSIGKFFGGRDHTTVLYGYRKIADKMMSDPEFGRGTLQQEFLLDKSAWLRSKRQQFRTSRISDQDVAVFRRLALEPFAACLESNAAATSVAEDFAKNDIESAPAVAELCETPPAIFEPATAAAAEAPAYRNPLAIDDDLSSKTAVNLNIISEDRLVPVSLNGKPPQTEFCQPKGRQKPRQAHPDQVSLLDLMGMAANG